MKFTHVFCLCSFVLAVISEIGFVASQDAKTKTSDIVPDTNNNFTSLCTNDKCIMKCCPLGQVMHKIVVRVRDKLRRRTICDKFETEKTLDEIFDDVFIRKPNLSSFELVSSPKLLKIDKINVSEFGFNVYLSEKAELLLEKPNAYNRWTRIPNSQYCIDPLLISDKKNETISFNPAVWSFFIDVPNEVVRPTSSIPVAGMLVSCICMALMLVVYGLLPELRSLSGLTLMAYVACQLCSFLLLLIMRIKAYDVVVCEYLTYLIYWFFLATFCWLNVMSYDIWWTLGGYAKAISRLRRNKSFKFLMYCIYAFGLPLAMTVGLAVLNRVDMTHIPSFITPKIPSDNCFIREGEKLLYLYVPMLILILNNWIFFIMTAIHIWKIDRESAAIREANNSHAGRSNQQRFIIYLKLSVIMGLNWVLEMLNYTSIGPTAWFISDCYNSLIGVIIFVIFVCKRDIFRNLQKRFGINTKSESYPDQEDHSACVTQEPRALPTVRYTPNGEDIAKMTYE